MYGIEEREWNKPLDRLREDGKWGLDSDKQKRDTFKNVIYAIYDIAGITIYN